MRNSFLVCVSLKGRDIIEMQRKAEKAFSLGADAVEFRLDMLNSISNLEVLRSYAGKCIIKINKSQYRDELIDSSPLYLDVPFGIQKKGLKLTKERMIISYHDFKKTPSREYLRAVMHESSRLGVPKIVTKANSLQDAINVLSLYRERKNIIAFCMGENAVFSRFACLLLGCPVLYSCLPGEELADGQPDILHTLKVIENLR